MHLIASYEFGRMTIAGKAYHKDVIVLPERIISPWWREKGHVLQKRDLEQYIMQFPPDILIVGTGKFGVMTCAKAFSMWCETLGIQLTDAKTEEAVHLFNLHAESGKSVVGAFHLTC